MTVPLSNPSGVANVNSSSYVATGSDTFTIRTVNTYGRMVYDPEANATTSVTLSR